MYFRLNFWHTQCTPSTPRVRSEILVMLSNVKKWRLKRRIEGQNNTGTGFIVGFTFFLDKQSTYPWILLVKFKPSLKSEFGVYFFFFIQQLWRGRLKQNCMRNSKRHSREIKKNIYILKKRGLAIRRCGYCSVSNLIEDRAHKFKPTVVQYSALSIYRGRFSSYNLRKTPHSSPVMARYGVSFVSANLTEILSLYYSIRINCICFIVLLVAARVTWPFLSLVCWQEKLRDPSMQHVLRLFANCSQKYNVLCIK